MNSAEKAVPRTLSGHYLWQVSFGMESRKVISVLATTITDAIEKSIRADSDCWKNNISKVEQKELYVYFENEGAE